VHWPKGIQGKGELRTQFSHVIDVAPTILELAGLPQPLALNGVQQHPIEGVSMAYAFNDAKASERHETQYFTGTVCSWRAPSLRHSGCKIPDRPTCPAVSSDSIPLLLVL